MHFATTSLAKVRPLIHDVHTILGKVSMANKLKKKQHHRAAQKYLIAPKVHGDLHPGYFEASLY